MVHKLYLEKNLNTDLKLCGITKHSERKRTYSIKFLSIDGAQGFIRKTITT